MNYAIRHTTTYRYSRSVFLEPHTLKFRPRSDGAQQLVDYKLMLNPQPAGLSEIIDPEGNCGAVVWFSGMTSTLEIVVDIQVRTTRTNPFDFIFTDSAAMRLPARYEPVLEALLAPARVRVFDSALVEKFAQDAANDARHGTLAFLSGLTHNVYEMSEKIIREHGLPNSPEETLRERVGSCRDLAVLFMDACRVMGLAARFVSGYSADEAENDIRHLHAWVEVYLPGGGWRAYDPTNGLAVTDRHVVVSASADPISATPVTGSLRGTNATTEMTVDISLNTTA